MAEISGDLCGIDDKTDAQWWNKSHVHYCYVTSGCLILVQMGVEKFGKSVRKNTPYHAHENNSTHFIYRNIQLF